MEKHLLELFAVLVRINNQTLTYLYYLAELVYDGIILAKVCTFVLKVLGNMDSEGTDKGFFFF